MAALITARIRRMREGNIFSLFTLSGEGVPCPRFGLGGGNPIPGVEGGYPIPGMDRGGGYPIPDVDGGYPIPGPDGGGYPIPGVDWGVPHPADRGGVLHPRSGWGGGYPILLMLEGTPIQDQVPPLSGDRSAKRALATRRAVCLLHSHRRTSLF